MTNQEPAQNEKTMIIWGLLVVSIICLAPFGIGLILRGSSDNSSSGNCYEQAGQEILKREGSKAVSKSDIERYNSELRNRCG
ncbi:hypothetical protein [Nostoc sp. 'Peltigera membranacea cyanobiont' 232]|uniref:hypothetical protein n=1 Tax=Nostoc sp. 'Peltigera membranacea cyanobiont' 232 TaxID=2014531 RepID=UPI00117E9694|nr:hypothetical protein [Nostoc sp. 'Peltigera membranacea cyanobiont' 232]